MTTYYISTVRSDKTMDNGLVRKVNEQYLVDALSFAEAEARTFGELKQYANEGEFSIPSIVQPRISAALLDGGGERFYRVKYVLVTLNEKTGLEKETTVALIIRADDFADAYNSFRHYMEQSVADYRLLAITETPIVDYIPADNDGENQTTQQ